MLDREIGLPGPGPENAAAIPTVGETRVERQGPVDHPDHGTNVLAEIRQHEGGVGEDAWVILRHLERLPSKIDGLTAISVGPAVDGEPPVAHRGPGKCRPVMGIDRDRLFKQSQSLDESLLRYGVESRERARVEIIRC